MSSYSLTKARVVQYVGILFALGLIAVGYWYFSVRAGVTIRPSNGLYNTGLVVRYFLDEAAVGYAPTVAEDSSTSRYDLTVASYGTGNMAWTEVAGNRGLESTATTGTQRALRQINDTSDALRDALAGKQKITLEIVVDVDACSASNSRIFGINDRLGSVGTMIVRCSSPSAWTAYWNNGYYEVFAPVGTGRVVLHVVIDTTQATGGDRVRVYENGTLLTHDPASNSPDPNDTLTIPVSSDLLMMNRESAGTWDRSFDGILYYAAIYKQAFTQTEVTTNSTVLLASDDSDIVRQNSAQSQPQGTGRLYSNLVGYWKFDETSGSTATDASVNGSNGTLTNMEADEWGAGRIGGALDFNASNEYVNVGSPAVLDDLVQTTICAWVNPDTIGTDPRIYTKSAADGSGGVQINLIVTVNRFSFRHGWSGATAARWETATDTVTTGVWQHLCATYDGGNVANVPVLYINGRAMPITEASAPVGTLSSDAAYDVLIGNQGNADRIFDGKIDEVRVYDLVLSADEIAQLYQITTPTGIDTSLKGYWSFNGQDVSGTTAYDRSGARNTGTLTGGPTKAIGVLGQGLNFDGTDDYVNVGSATNIDDLVSKTICAWVNPETLPDTYKSIMSQMNNGGAESTFGFFSTASNPRLTYYRSFSGAPGEWDAPIGLVPLNTWSQVCMTYTNSSAANDPIFYINGVSVPVNERATPSGTASATGGGDYFIGALDDGGSGMEFLDGKIDEVRLYSRILSAGEVKSLYDAAAPDKANSSASQAQGTGRLDSGLLGYWKLDDGTSGATPTTAADSATGGNNGTLTNSPTWTTGRIGNGVTFNGTTQYITMGDIAAIDGVTALTVSAWAKSSSLATERTIVAKSGCSGGADGGPFSMGAGDVAGTAEFVIYPSGGTPSSYYKALATSTMDDGNWHLVTGTYDGASARIYMDGTLSATVAAPAGDLASTSNIFEIGSCVGGSNFFWNDAIDEVRVYNRALSADEVGQLYAVTTPTGTDTSLKGYWSFNGQDISGTTAYDRSGAGNTGTLTGGPTKTIGKLGQALSFDGANDYIDVGSSSALQSSVFTYAAWINPSGSSIRTIKGNNSSSGPQFRLTTGGSLELLKQSVGSIATSTSSVTNGVWSHVAVTYDNGTGNYNFYINGTSAGSGTSGQSFTFSAVQIGIRDAGGGGAEPFSGKIDEVRIYNRALTASEILGLYNQTK